MWTSTKGSIFVFNIKEKKCNIMYEIDNERVTKLGVNGNEIEQIFKIKNIDINLYNNFIFNDSNNNTWISSSDGAIRISKDNIDIIIVTLNCGNDFDIHENLFEKYFNNYVNINILQKGRNKILDYIIISEKKYSILLEKEKIQGGTLLYCVYPSSLLIEVYVIKDNDQKLVFKDKILEFDYA